MSTTTEPDGTIRSRVYSRIGLLGNPSDGFGGACLSLSLKNFYAEVTLRPSDKLRFLPNPECDPLEFASLDAFAAHASGAGVYGGLRLLQAACLRFFRHCAEAGLALTTGGAAAAATGPDDAAAAGGGAGGGGGGPGNFELSYATTIPRQRGLSGSSAIVTAALNCLLRHYRLEGAVPLEARPQLALEAEGLLGIAAGLQDRVIQVYGGLVLMDFSPERVQAAGRGRYASLDPALLPPLYLLYRPAGLPGKDSGAVHSDVKQRWLAGDADVRQGMREIAALAEAGRQALLARDLRSLAALLAANFRLRCQLYGGAAVGQDSLAMVEAAASVGAAAKLTGSGGAVVALCPEGEAQAGALRAACAARGLECVAVEVGPALHQAADGP